MLIEGSCVSEGKFVLVRESRVNRREGCCAVLKAENYINVEELC